MSQGSLTALQVRILAVLADLDPRWVLTGGGALAGFHTRHRTTRDLDLVWHERPHLEELVGKVKDRLVEAGLDVTTIQQAPSFHRIEVRAGEAMCLLDLVADPTPHLAAPETQVVEGRTIQVEGKHTILVNKLCAILGRRELRDFIDVRELVLGGEDLERASRDAPRRDGGYSPIMLSWIVKGTPIETMARAADMPPSQAAELERFREHLIERLTQYARPDEGS